MYTPSYTKSEDIAEAFELMDTHPFATMISLATPKLVDGKHVTSGLPPVISHLPLVTVLRDGTSDFSKASATSLEIIGHCARANPHWRNMTAGPATVVFQGAHAYISPTWYAENDVPTWAYSAVHVTGRVELIEDYDGLISCLKTLSARAEHHWPSGWEFFLPDDLSSPQVLVKSIVGFKIHVETLQYKKKLSQNRSAVDRQGVIDGLERRGDPQSLAVRTDMLKLKK